MRKVCGPRFESTPNAGGRARSAKGQRRSTKTQVLCWNIRSRHDPLSLSCSFSPFYSQNAQSYWPRLSSFNSAPSNTVMHTPPLPFDLQGDPFQEFDCPPFALVTATDMQRPFDNEAASGMQLPFDDTQPSLYRPIQWLPSWPCSCPSTTPIRWSTLFLHPAICLTLLLGHQAQLMPGKFFFFT